jgi:hypothetical protein
MDTKHPLSAKRLHALMGDKIHDIPPYFVEQLERKLEEMEQQRAQPSRVVRLRPVKAVNDQRTASNHDGTASLPHVESVAIPVTTLRALAYTLDILHTAHLFRQDHVSVGMVSEQMVEGLIISGQEMLKGYVAATWADA